ncbi:MAG TPA: SGNH/GDSL hydrolase family protein [Planctomycetota bacterium]|jgi:lysophospholipase L1-like esterase|nr:SGNH/GDSL hydrolase family protein [Planctomycetota bacterium]
MRRRLPLVLGGLLASIPLAETAVRVRARVQGFTIEEARLRYLGRGSTDPVYVPHPYLARALRPGAVFEYRNYLGDVVPWRINSSGYRGDEVASPKPPGRFRVVCLGASTTFGGENPDGKTYPDVLGRLLREARPGVDLETVNAGVPGYTSIETLIDFALRGQALEPDLVVLYHGVNDVPALLTPGFRPDYAHWRPLPPREPEGLDAFLQKSLLWLALVHRERAHPPKREATPLPEPPPKALEAFARHTSTIAALARARGAKVVLATFAEAIDVYPEMAAERALFAGLPHPAADAYRRTLASLNEGLRATAGREGLLLVDLAARLPRNKKIFYDWLHWTDEGCAEVARILAEEIVAAGLLPPGR